MLGDVFTGFGVHHNWNEALKITSKTKMFLLNSFEMKNPKRQPKDLERYTVEWEPL